MDTLGKLYPCLREIERERERHREGEYGQLNGQKWEELDTKHKNIAKKISISNAVFKSNIRILYTIF